MNYKLLGSSGLRVSEFALGTMTIGNAWGWGSEKEESKKIFEAFSKEGGNFIDTSCNYQDGKSEEYIGDFISGDRDRYVIATKYSLHDFKSKDDPNSGGNHRKNLIRSVNGSLERLNTKYLDVLYLHMWDFTTNIEEIMRTLNDLISSTKVNYIAISDTPAWIIASANMLAKIRGWEPFVAVQFPYNIELRDAEREIIPMAKHFDMGMTTFRIIGSGLFSGKYTRNKDATGRISETSGKDPERLALAKKVDEIADELGVTSSQVAIRWILQQKGQFIPILGATKQSQIEDNLGALKINLTKEIMDKLTNLSNFNIGFPSNFIFGEHVQKLIHGETSDKLLNHRL